MEKAKIPHSKQILVHSESEENDGDKNTKQSSEISSEKSPECVTVETQLFNKGQASGLAVQQMDTGSESLSAVSTAEETSTGNCTEVETCASAAQMINAESGIVNVSADSETTVRSGEMSSPVQLTASQSGLLVSSAVKETAGTANMQTSAPSVQPMDINSDSGHTVSVSAAEDTARPSSRQTPVPVSFVHLTGSGSDGSAVTDSSASIVEIEAGVQNDGSETSEAGSVEVISQSSDLQHVSSMTGHCTRDLADAGADSQNQSESQKSGALPSDSPDVGINRNGEIEQNEPEIITNADKTVTGSDTKDVTELNESKTKSPLLTAAESSGMAMVENKVDDVSKNENNNQSDDDVDDIITLKEEDFMPGFVITNVCSIREEEKLDEESDGEADSESQSSRSEPSANKSLHLEDSSVVTSHASESEDCGLRLSETEKPTAILDSTSSILPSSGHAGSHGGERNTLSTCETLQAVCGLASSQKRLGNNSTPSSSDDPPSVLAPSTPSCSAAVLAVPSAAEPSVAGSEDVAESWGAGKKESAAASALQNLTGYVRRASDTQHPSVTFSRDLQNVTDREITPAATGEMHCLSSKQNTTNRHEQDEDKEPLIVKLEPADTGYETGPGAVSTVPEGPSSVVKAQSASQFTNRKKLPSKTKGGEEARNNGGHLPKKQRSMEKTSTNSGSQSSKAQQKGRLDATPPTSAGVTTSCQSSTTTTTPCSSSKVGSGPDSIFPEAKGRPNLPTLQSHGTLSKPLLVPPSCTTRKPSSQSDNIPTKSVFITLPPTLAVNRTSASQLTTSGTSETVKSTSSQSESSSLESVSSASSKDEQLNEQLKTHLRHVQDKPGSHQIIAIPMPDGSTHKVKVVFAPAVQPQTPVTKTIDSSPSESLVTNSNETHLHHVQGKPGSHQTIAIPMPDGSTHKVKVVFAPSVQPQTIDLSSSESLVTNNNERGSAEVTRCSTAVTPSPGMSFTVIGGQGSKPNPMLSSYLTPTTIVTFRSAQPVTSSTRPAVSLLSSAANQAPSSGNSGPSTPTVASAQPIVSHAYMIRPAATSAATSAGARSIQSVVHSQTARPVTSSVSKPLVTQVNLNYKRDVRFDQVSTEAKLSASDMASLIQGKIFVPPLEPRRRPSSCGSNDSNNWNKVYRCVECGIMCTTLVGYTVHVKRMSMVIRYACMTCKAALVFFNKCTFLAHLRKHSAADSSGSGQVVNLKSYTMSVSSLPEELLPPIDLQHMDPLVMNRNRPIICTECRETFCDSSQLAVHFGTESRTCSFEYSCTHCKMELPTACSLQAHLRLHDEESHTLCARPDFVCPDCGLCFPNQVALYQHLFATCLHFSRCVTLRCVICKQFQPTLEVLKEHLMVYHPNHKRFQCLRCRRIYHSLASFQHHIPQLHKSERNLSWTEDSYQRTASCIVCRSLTLEGKDHALLHVGEQKRKARFGYACLFCHDNNLFNLREDLVKHLATQHRAYRFTCPICTQGFVTLSLLRIHILLEHSNKGQPMQVCLKCNFNVLCSDSVLPHAMWHVMKTLAKASSQSESSTLQHKKYCMEINVPKMHARPSDQPRQMLLCRTCGHVSSTRFALHRHIAKANHVFCKQYYVCPFCQRYDFHNSIKFWAHCDSCLIDSGVHDSIVIADSQEDEERQEPNAAGQKDDSSCMDDSGSKSGARSVSATFDTSSTGPKSAPSAVSSRDNTATPNTQEKIPLSPFSRKRQAILSRSGPAAKVAKMKEVSSVNSSRNVVIVLPLHKPSPSQQSVVGGHTENGGGAAEDHVVEVSQPDASHAEVGNQSPQKQLYPCHLCGLTYKSADTLDTHLAGAHGGERNVLHCKLCRKKGKEVLFSKNFLKKHLTRRHNMAKPVADAMIAAQLEQELGTSKISAALGSPSMSTDSENSTSSFSDQSPIKRLRVAGDDQQEYMCAKCGFGSLLEEEFQRHIADHKVENCVQCLECGLSFSAVSSLKKHLFMVHKVKEPGSYVQQHNIKMDELPMELASHMDLLAPLGEPEVVIKTARVFHDTLPKTRPASEGLKERRLLRSKERDESLFECNVCYKDFKLEAALKTHMRTHGMAFIRSRRIHTRQSVGAKTPQREEEQQVADPVSQIEKNYAQVGLKLNPM